VASHIVAGAGPRSDTRAAGGALPRWSAVDRLRARAGYAWNNSPHPLLRWTRGCWDGRGGAAPVVVSTAAEGELSIAYAGLPVGEANILQLLEHQRRPVAGGVAGRTRGRTSWPELCAGQWPSADIVVVGGELHRIQALPPERSLVAPFRVHLVVEVATDPAAMQQRISKRERWEFRRNRKRHEWTLEEDSSASALQFFYHRMHVPTMRQRHGERSRTESVAVAQHGILRRGCLFFVRAGDTRVAGVLCHWSADRRTLTTRLLGVLDGAAEHYQDGAFKAVYHLLLEWAAIHGIPRVDFFGTEALISKGIFQWKRKFDPRVELPPNHFSTKRMYLLARRDTRAVRDFLVANPMLVTSPDGLQPVYFTDAARPARLEISAACPGLGEPRLLDLDEFLAGAPGGPR
jgi:hypothetical protein